MREVLRKTESKCYEYTENKAINCGGGRPARSAQRMCLSRPQERAATYQGVKGLQGRENNVCKGVGMRTAGKTLETKHDLE